VAFWVAGVYLALGLAWIFVSDRLVHTMVSDPVRQAQIETAKGWAFVILSAAVLYWVLRGTGKWLRRSEARRYELERTQATLLANLPSGIVYRCRDDADWTMELVSAGCRELTGYGQEDLVHNKRAAYADLIHPDDRDEVRDRVTAAVAADAPFQLTYRIVTADSVIKWVWEQGRRVQIEGEDRLEGVILDVTEQRQIEDQWRRVQQLESMGALAGGVAHDFNNLLAVILVNVELARQELPGQSAVLAEDLNAIHQAATSGVTLVRNLLGFARSSALMVESVDVVSCLEKTVTMLRRLLPESIEIRAEGEPDARPAMRADPAGVQQIVLNLAANARDAMPLGGRLVLGFSTTELDESYCDTHPWVVPGTYVCLSVHDTGVGMDADTQARVFEPLFTTKPPGKGTGLGMPMVLGLMKQMQGHVNLYSEPGQGTTVRLYFPQSEIPAVTRASGPVSVPALGRAETVLLVEDDASLRRAGRRALESLGYTVLEAAHGEEALAVLAQKEDQVAVVLSDVVMPRLGGPGLYQRLRATRPALPFILMSGYAPEALREDVELGPEVVLLGKPWTLTELARRVRQALDG
jgi:PAS domain S-box-containing protein